MSSLIPTKRGSLLFPALALLASLASFSATAAQVSYDFNDNVVPAGTTVSGSTAISGGVVHLTDDGAAGVQGYFVVPDIAAGRRVGNLVVRWKNRIGGVTQAGEATQFGRGGADGMSLSWGSDVAESSFTAEEGTGTGVSVTVDTFDNGGGEAPGIEIKYAGARVAFDPINADQGLAKDFLRKDQFVDAELVVDNNNCRATFTYDGRTISADLP